MKKKVCFIRFINDNSIYGNGFRISDYELSEWTNELFRLYHKENYPIEFIKYANLDSDVTLVASLSVVDISDELFLESLKRLLTIKCKKIFIDTSTYDHQEIPIEFYEFCRKESNKELWFLDKNLINVSNDILYYEQHMYHAINTLIENDTLECFRKLHIREQSRLKPHKGLFLSGHIRFHKVELLNYFYEKNLLNENFIWSCTDENWEPDSFRNFVPKEREAEFRNFKILEALPHMADLNYSKIKLEGGYSPNVNVLHYLSTYFEIILETQFYKKNGTNQWSATRNDWNNISEKTLKSIRMGNPFILVSKPNTLKLLKERFGFDFEMNGWMHEYDTIENDNDRMKSIQNKINSTLECDNLHELHYEYFNRKFNNDIFIENFYKQTLNIIFNKF